MALLIGAVSASAARDLSNHAPMIDMCPNWLGRPRTSSQHEQRPVTA
jgi:hypothetical protein